VRIICPANPRHKQRQGFATLLSTADIPAVAGRRPACRRSAASCGAGMCVFWAWTKKIHPRHAMLPQACHCTLGKPSYVGHTASPQAHHLKPVHTMSPQAQAGSRGSCICSPVQKCLPCPSFHASVAADTAVLYGIDGSTDAIVHVVMRLRYCLLLFCGGRGPLVPGHQQSRGVGVTKAVECVTKRVHRVRLCAAGDLGAPAAQPCAGVATA